MSGKRSRAREYAVQALYQWQVTGQDVKSIELQFLEDEDVARFDVDLFHELIHGVPGSVNSLDEALAPLLDRSVSQVDPVERAVLRLGAYELTHHLDVPYRVIINEAVELAKLFGADQGHRYVNGVLDKLAQRLRTAEARPGPRGHRRG